MKRIINSLKSIYFKCTHLSSWDGLKPITALKRVPIEYVIYTHAHLGRQIWCKTKGIPYSDWVSVSLCCQFGIVVAYIAPYTNTYTTSTYPRSASLITWWSLIEMTASRYFIGGYHICIVPSYKIQLALQYVSDGCIDQVHVRIGVSPVATFTKEVNPR